MSSLVLNILYQLLLLTANLSCTYYCEPHLTQKERDTERGRATLKVTQLVTSRARVCAEAA